MIANEVPNNLSDWGTWLVRNSILAFLLCSMSWWVATYVLQPLLDDNRDNTRQIISNNTKMAEAVERLSTSITSLHQVRMADAESLKRLVDLQERQVKTQEDSNKIQSALLEATRSGAWLNKSGSGT